MVPEFRLDNKRGNSTPPSHFCVTRGRGSRRESRSPNTVAGGRKNGRFGRESSPGCPDPNNGDAREFADLRARVIGV